MPENLQLAAAFLAGLILAAVIAFLMRARDGSFRATGKVGIGGVEFTVDAIQTGRNEATLQLVGTNDDGAKLGIPTVIQTQLDVTHW